ncbi:DUF4062 domain-containing protein [Roseovarius sp. EL26]|uniref:DUF4062 domain-containing protein n=1 Tax=Roseovarius sp. EL26 TaxID=2126672 RepID=UPI0013C4261D|nr:DUF4062 domain-containing protein [Roseovarius sp. EL26]
MQDKMKLIRVFIGSPGGLEDERRAAHAIVEEVNRDHSEHWGCHFKLLGWEDTVPGYQRPQSKINEDLDRCDYFIGVLWNRWGTTPTNDPAGYTSGFEEEFHRAERRIQEGKMKDMLLLFKKVEIPAELEPGEDLKKVRDFRQQQIDGKRNYFRDFEDLSGFKDAIRSKLNDIGWKEAGHDRTVADDDSAPTNRAEPEHSESTQEASENAGLLEGEARSFVTGFLSKSDAWEETSPHEIARFRLIATSVSRSGNDELYLSNHDANLMFRHYRNEKLSDQEFTALIDSGVAGFEHSNVPLWRWVAKGDMLDHALFFRLRLLATVGEDREKVNSIKVLQLLGSGIPSHDSEFNVANVLRWWFAEGSSEPTFNAAISFLATNATESELPFVEQALSEAPESRRDRIEGAIVGILSRVSVDKALKRVCERGVDRIPEPVVKRLFNSAASLSTDTLLECLSAKSDSVRVPSAQLLADRSEIKLETAQTLLTDSNLDIRLVAAEVLHKLGLPLDEEVAKTALTQKKNVGRGLLGLSMTAERDTTRYDAYRQNRLLEMSETELRDRASKKLIFQSDELAALFDKFRSKAAIQKELRQNLSDGFEKYFQARIAAAREKYGADDKVISDSENLSTYYRLRLSSLALEALCRLQKRDDLDLVRQVLTEFEVAASPNILSYFKKFGEWRDITTVDGMSNVARNTNALLALASVDYSAERASTILQIGKTRLSDLLELELKHPTRLALLKKIPATSLRELHDDVLLRELSRDDNESRIVFALRCVQALPKSRVAGLLDRYMDADAQRYYNSIHWLDLGASLPTRIAKSVAARALEQR